MIRPSNGNLNIAILILLLGRPAVGQLAPVQPTTRPPDETSTTETEFPVPQSPPTSDSPEPDTSSDDDENVDQFELMKMFIDALDEVQRNYVEPISRRELMEAAMNGVLSKLDAYSDYIPPDDIDDFRRDVESEFSGIGVQVEMGEESVRVVFPLPGSPGQKAGMLLGDQILAIDGQLTKGLTLEQSIRLIKGPRGTKVRLQIRHADGEEEELTIRRGNIVLDTVASHARDRSGKWNYVLDKEKKIGYIRIRSFSSHTPDEVKAALEELEAQGIKRLVLDLRFNPGGLLDAAIEVCDLFIDSGRIVATEGRNVEPQSWDASSEGTFTDMTVAVLVNQYSASASEIVSACLKDHQRAVVIGERTWGKGSVQKVIELEAGRSALKLTTAIYVRPNGKNIHRFESSKESDQWGVTPNEEMEVKLNDEQTRLVLMAQSNASLVPTASRPQTPFYIDAQLQLAIDYLSSDKPSTPSTP